MNLKDYIHNLQQKPVRERERIAVIATAVGFSVILVIWLVSFNEMNKPADVPVDETSASLNDLKSNFQDGKDSIQNMMQQMPTSPAGGSGQAGAVDANSAGTAPSNDSLNPEGTLGNDSGPSPAASPNNSTSAGNGLQLPASDGLNSGNSPVENNKDNQNNQTAPGVPQLP